ncbi:hypothetical protein [Alsobacter sp. R-9]
MRGIRAAAALAGLMGWAVPGWAADLPAPAPAAAPQVPVVDMGWTFRATPYAWLTALNGTQTIKGRTMDVNASFADIVDNTIGDGGTLVALMLDMEARYGKFALLADVIAESISIDKSGFKTRGVTPGVTGTLGAGLDMQYQMAIVEAGGAYEVGQIGPVAFDVLAGARYWYQKIDATLDLNGTVDLGNLVVEGGRVVARSGSVDWIDAFAGARARVSIAPNQHLELRGDLGGGGSKFTWNALAAYAYDFTTRNGVTYSGVIGYKALYVDYVQGEGRNRYEFDMVQHGPVLGLSIRF